MVLAEQKEWGRVDVLVESLTLEPGAYLLGFGVDRLAD